jgi:hypothetical protein
MKSIAELNEQAAMIGLHETYHETQEEAFENAKERSKKSNRIVYVFSMEAGFMVCVHGVRRIGHKLVKQYYRGA